MSVIFTEHAVSRLSEHDFSQLDRARLLAALERASASPDTLIALGPPGRDGGVDGRFIVRAGDLRAVLTTDKRKPNDLIVVTVFRPQNSAVSKAPAVADDDPGIAHNAPP